MSLGACLLFLEVFQDHHPVAQVVHLLVPIRVLEEVEVRDNINEIFFKFFEGKINKR